MQKLFFLLLFASPIAAACQSVATILPKDCVYREGDDTGWASRELDESQWKPYSGWRAGATHSKLWIRCHANLNAIEEAAVQVRLNSAYELYFNGTRVGAFGNLDTGNFSLDSIRSYPVSPKPEGVAAIVLRVHDRGSLYNPGPAELSPFRRGVEITTPGGLPLGVAFDTQFTTSHATLEAGDALTLVSDGVVEARNRAGDLFGFERASVLSTRSAAEIALTAQAFGQEDDITVLTLSLRD